MTPRRVLVGGFTMRSFHTFVVLAALVSLIAVPLVTAGHGAQAVLRPLGTTALPDIFIERIGGQMLQGSSYKVHFTGAPVQLQTPVDCFPTNFPNFEKGFDGQCGNGQPFHIVGTFHQHAEGDHVPDIHEVRVRGPYSPFYNDRMIVIVG